MIVDAITRHAEVDEETKKYLLHEMICLVANIVATYETESKKKDRAPINSSGSQPLYATT